MMRDAILAYLHFISIFLLFAFLTAQALLLRAPLDDRGIRVVGIADRWYGAAAVAVLVTGFLRLYLGAKGAPFHLGAWPVYAKLATFIAVGLISIVPTIAFIRWRKALQRDAAWRVAAPEQARMRRLVMIEIHLAALIPVFAVMMARGLGYR